MPDDLTSSTQSDTDLHRLLDEAAIRRLLARYCHLVDQRSPRAIATEIFTVDGRDDHGLYGAVAEGHHGIEAMFERSNQSTESSAHFVTNSIIDVDGDHACARTYVTSWTWLRSTAHLGRIRPVDFVITAIYVDALRREPAGWRIADRRLEPLGPGALGFGNLPDVYRGVAKVDPDG